MKPIQLVTAALITAAMCVVAPVTVPMGVIPLSAATVCVYLAAALLGSWNGALCTIVYILIGTLGVPVFAGYSAGAAQVMGITGGFILGYIPCVIIAGAILSRRSKGWRVPLAFAVGTLALYAVGTVWYMWQTGSSLVTALSLCVLPFLLGDAVKIAAATGLVGLLRRS